MLEPTIDDYVDLAQAGFAKLIVVVDTEEEFDWFAGQSRDKTSVQAMRSVDRI